MTPSATPTADTLHVAQLGRVQTGAVATMPDHLALYHAGERGAQGDTRQLAIAPLYPVGLSARFLPQQWIDGDNPGRNFVGIHAQAYLRTRVTPQA